MFERIPDNTTQPAGHEAPPLNHSARRINHLAKALAAKTYLEVGVASGRTFFSVDIEHKHAVDPHFLFDYQSKQTDKVRLFQMTSDDYFSRHANDMSFDIMFLDGLHVFEQTFRDFCNAINHIGNDSIIVIDDTYPNDIFSTWTNQAEAVNFRLNHSANKTNAWHGDVFKMVFAIHDFFPVLSYLTISNGGNPQTIVWREPRAHFRPAFNSLEAIGRMTWFDLQNNLRMLNLTRESEALHYVCQRIASRREKAAPATAA